MSEYRDKGPKGQEGTKGGFRAERPWRACLKAKALSCLTGGFWHSRISGYVFIFR